MGWKLFGCWKGNILGKVSLGSVFFEVWNFVYFVGDVSVGFLITSVMFG